MARIGSVVMSNSSSLERKHECDLNTSNSPRIFSTIEKVEDKTPRLEP